MSTLQIESTPFYAMGSECFVAVLGGDPAQLLRLAQRRAEDLEGKWSRFRSDSELSRLNQSGSARVSADTLLLIDHAVTAWKWTNGVFDPSVLELVNAAGYDRNFANIIRTHIDSSPSGSHTPGKPRPQKSPGCRDVSVDYANSSVTLPSGVGLDPGGIGKGLAADLIAETLIEAGALGTLVSMGGDMRAFGESPDDGWIVGIADPKIPGNILLQVSLGQQGLATSNRKTRMWTHDGLERNHLIHPTNGKSATGYVAASAIAGQAWWAEVLTKVAMLGGIVGPGMAHALGGKILVIDEDNNVTVTDGWNLSPSR